MAIADQAGTLLRTMACPIPADQRPKLRGARRASPLPPRPAGPITVQRRVCSRGSIMVATQKIHAGMIYARKTATVTAGDDHFTVAVDGETVAVVPRTTTREIHRYKALRDIEAASQLTTPGTSAVCEARALVYDTAAALLNRVGEPCRVPAVCG